MDADEGGALLVFTNLPDRGAALKLAQGLVAKRLAACVNVLSGCTSVYRWEGTVEQTDDRALRLSEAVGRGVRELRRFPGVRGCASHDHQRNRADRDQ